MGVAEQQVGISRGLAKRLLPTALGIGLIISLVFPAAYYTLRINDLDREASIYADSLGRELELALSESPALWKYQAAKYHQILDEFIPGKGLAVIRVLDEAERPIPGYTHTVSAPHRWGLIRPHMGTAPLLVQRRLVGTVQVEVSQDGLLGQSLIVLLGSALIGIGLAAVVYRLPITVVARLEARLTESVAVVERASTRLEALVKANRMLSASLDMDETLRTILHEAAVLSGAPMVRLLLLEEDGKLLRLRISEGLPRDATAGLAIPIGESFSGHVAATGEPLAVTDTRGDPRDLYPDAVRYGLVSYLGLPVKRGEHLLGVLAFNTNAPRVYSPEEIEIVSTFAAQAAIAIENARLLETIEHRVQQLVRLSELTKHLVGSLDTEQVGTEVLGAMQALVPGSVGRLWDLEEGEATMRLMASAGLRDARGGTVDFRRGEGMAWIAVTTLKPVGSQDITRDPRFVNQAWAAAEGLRSAICLPLLHGDRVHGILAVMRRVEQEFSGDEVAILEGLAGHAAVALANARLHRETVRRGEQMESLLRSLKTMTSGLDLEEILDRIIAEAARIARTPHVKILLLGGSEGSKRLQLASVQGFDHPDFPAPLAQSLSGTVAATGQLLFVADSQDDSRNPNAAFDRQWGLRTYLGIPVRGRHGVLGVLTFNTTEPRAYGDEELSYLTSFADQAAIAIENARLYSMVKEHADILELRIVDRTRELVAALHQAETASRAKSDFLLNVSHELRTPLNAVLGFSQLLQRQVATQLEPKQARYLDHIHESGRHLLDLINEILDLGRIEAGQTMLQCEAVDVAPLVEGAVTLVGELAHRKGLVVHTEISPELPSVWADPVRLKQILFNLLSNAVKFTPPGGTATVRARTVLRQSSDLATRQSGHAPNCRVAELPNCPPPEWLEIAVTDTGIGITPNDLPRLFQPFMQLEDPIRKRHDGTGLGLALTRRLVELHGGTITAASSGEGRGEHVHHPVAAGRGREAGGVRRKEKRMTEKYAKLARGYPELRIRERGPNPPLGSNIKA